MERINWMEFRDWVPELIDTVLAKDKEFVKWRREHTESFAPRAAAARKNETGHGGRRRPLAGPPSHGDSAGDARTRRGDHA